MNISKIIAKVRFLYHHWMASIYCVLGHLGHDTLMYSLAMAEKHTKNLRAVVVEDIGLTIDEKEES